MWQWYIRAGQKDPQSGAPVDRFTSVGWKEAQQSIGSRKEPYPVVMIRLARFGARKQPCYRIVVIEKDRARNGLSLIHI